MKEKNKIICERFEKVMNSDFIIELLKSNNISLKDVVKTQDNLNSKLMNFIYVYLKLIDTNEFLEEDINLFVECCNIPQNDLISIISNIVVARMHKIGLNKENIKEKILTELLGNRLYIHCTYEESAKNIDNSSNEKLDIDLNKIISIFSMYGKERLFEYVRFDNGLFYYAGNFDYAAAYCYTSPEWLYILLGDAYISRNKEQSFQKLDNHIKNFDPYYKEYIMSCFEKIWTYYNKYSNKPNILFFEGNNVDDKNDIYFYWHSNESEVNNLSDLLRSISYINNKSTKQKIDSELFKRVSLPALNEIASLNNQQNLKR